MNAEKILLACPTVGHFQNGDPLRDMLIAQINAAIASAVQSEREACAKVAEGSEDGHTMTYSDADDDYNATLGYNEACSKIASAIRARK